MSELFEQIQELIDQARELPPGPSQIDLLVESVRLADLMKEQELQYHLRMILISAAFEGGGGEVLLSSVAWCLAEFDKSPDQFDPHGLLWRCKHALSYITGFFSVPRKQIQNLALDVYDRCRKSSYSLRGPYTFGMSNELSMGHFESAKEIFEKYESARHDDLCEPKDWELYFETKFVLDTQGEDAAIEKAQPLLTGEMKDSDVRQWAALILYEALVKREDLLPLAMEIHRQSYPGIKGNPKYFGHFARHIFLLATTSNFQRAIEIFENNLIWLAGKPILPSSQLAFFRDGCFLFELMNENGMGETKIRTPKNLFEELSDQEPTPTSLAPILRQRAESLTVEFDKRNQNKYISTLFHDLFELKQYQTDFPV